MLNLAYWVPAHQGVDQNGYIVGGKMLAQHWTMKFVPSLPGSAATFDPHQFVGRMWVGADHGTASERYYPKYPIGLPLLFAVAMKLGGASGGAVLVYWINPVAMTLATFATFYLLRLVGGSFLALLATIAFATSPVTLGLTNEVNSHATTVCCVAWGMFFLLRWWQEGGDAPDCETASEGEDRSRWWRWFLVSGASLRRIGAGVLLGYACTIRYTEGLLVVPLVLVALFNLRWRDWRSWVDSALLGAWWAVPVLALLTYNVRAIGSLTGYDTTNESTGFAL
ncbi:MAG: hypothetical protein ACREIT_08220, partial [Tepidisphaeraceae bacterium]